MRANGAVAISRDGLVMRLINDTGDMGFLDNVCAGGSGYRFASKITTARPLERRVVIPVCPVPRQCLLGRLADLFLASGPCRTHQGIVMTGGACFPSHNDRRLQRQRGAAPGPGSGSAGSTGCQQTLSSRRLPIAKFAISFSQIPNSALVGTPPIFIAPDLQPFLGGGLGERLGCELDRVHHGGGSGSARSPVGGAGSSAAANGLCRGRLGAEASPSTQPVSMQLWARARPHSSKVVGRPASSLSASAGGHPFSRMQRARMSRVELTN